MKKIIVNGKEYKSLSDLPGMLQDVLKDENKNGLPDIADNAIQDAKSGTTTTTNTNKISYNGVEYNNLDEMPPEARAKVEEKFKSAGINSRDLNVHNVISALGGPVGWGISKLLKLPGSQGAETPKTPFNKETQKESHEITQIESNRPNAIGIDEPKPDELPGVKDDKSRSLIFALVGLGVIGWLVYSLLNTGA